MRRRARATRPRLVSLETLHELPAGVGVAAIVLLSLVSYAPLWNAEYVQDDHIAIESNPVVERGDPGEIFGSSYWKGSQGDDRTLYRPVTILTWALERTMLGRSSPRLTHAVNVLLHLVSALLLFALARRCGAGRFASFAAGALFALHPVHTEAVANGVGRSELLAAVFVLAALLAQSKTGAWPPDPRFLAPQPWRARLAAWGAAVSLFLALGSKETAAAAIVLLPMQDLLFRPPGRGKLGAWIAERAAALAPSLVAVELYLVLRVHALESFFALQTVPAADNPLVQLDGLERLSTALAIAARYARLLLLPVRLAADYSGHVIPTEPGLLAPMPLAGLAVLALWIVLGSLGLASQARASSRVGGASPTVRLVGFAAWLFLLPYLVIGNLLVTVGAGVAERFLYLPSAGYCLLLGAVLGRLFDADLPLLAGGERQRRRLVASALGLLLCGFALLTASRCLEWRSDATLFAAAARVNPASPRAHFILGTIQARAGDVPGALREIDRALEAFPEYTPGWQEKGVRLAQSGDLPGAEAALREVIRQQPSYAPAHLNLGLALHRQNRRDEAEKALRKAVLWDPGSDKAWADLGHLRFEGGRYRDAADAYRHAVALGRSDLLPRLRASEQRGP